MTRRASVQAVPVQGGVSVWGVFVWGGLCLGRVFVWGGLCPGGSLSRGLGSLSGGLCLEGFCPGGSLSRGGLCPGGLCLWDLCPGGSLSRGSLSRGLCLGSLLGRPSPYGNEQAVYILLECILVTTQISNLYEKHSCCTVYSLT